MHPIRKTHAASFGALRILLWAVCLPVIVGGVIFSIHFARRASDFIDFGQFYMGGLMAHDRAWGDLYPTPVAGSIVNAGYVEGSTPTAYYAARARQVGIGNTLRFINPPPAALFFWPLSFLPANIAAWLWFILMAICGWLTAIYAGLFFEQLTRKGPLAGPVFSLILSISPRMIRSLSVANVSAAIALATALVMAGIIGRRRLLGAAALVFSAATKYATIVLLPVIILTRRWDMLVQALVGGAALLLISWGIMGPVPFVHFFHDIAPTLQRTSPDYGNDALLSVIMKMSDRLTPTQSQITAVKLIGALTGLAILAVLLRAAPRLNNAPSAFAAGAALYAWMLIFSPIYWQHYVLYLYPFCGWLGWEMFQRGWARFAAIFALAVAWMPSTLGISAHLGGRAGHMIEASHYLLVGTVVILGVALNRLLRGEDGCADASTATAGLACRDGSEV